MAWRGSLSRSISAAARSTSLRSPPATPRSRPPLVSTAHRRRPFPSRAGLMGEIGCVQSVLPLYSVVGPARLTSHLSVSVRACCELFQGT